jgi:Protein of unknown function DUF262
VPELLSPDSDLLIDLEDDEDLDEEITQDRLLYNPEKINIATKEPTIEQLLRRVGEDALDLAPDFQRHANLWKDENKSRLIESIMIRIPIPAFYIDGSNEDRWLVVDGLQRLSALKQFVLDKTLRLTGLEYLTSLEGKVYDEIDRRYQRRLEETQLTVYIIEKGTPPEVKFNIFKRINTGGLSLSPQELRHALNPGKSGHFLTELASSNEFKEIVGISDTKIMRMVDREFVLGFLAFSMTSDRSYPSKGRNLFLIQAMALINQFSDREFDDTRAKFKRALIANQKIFGKNAFRKTPKARKTPINQSLFESWMTIISNLVDDEIEMLVERKRKIIELFSNQMETDSKFSKSISQVADLVEYRFEIIDAIVKEVLK